MAHTPSSPAISSRELRRPYFRLPILIVAMTVVAIVMGTLVLYYVEERLIAGAGQNLTLAAAEIMDKLDRLLFERYGDVSMMARAFSLRMQDRAYLDSFLTWMKDAYAPVYVWLGVTDANGIVIASTDPSMLGRNWSQQTWFKAARESRRVHTGDVGAYEAVGGVEAVAFTAPIVAADGRFLGVVTTRLGTPMLEDVLTHTIHALEGRAKVLDHVEYQFMTRSGQVFIDSDLAHKGHVNLKTMGLRSAVLTDSDEPGYVEEEHMRRHLPVVTGYARTKGYGEFQGLGWSVLIRIDRSAILGPVRLVLLNIGIAGAAVWTPMFIALLWATGRLQREWAQTQQETARALAAEAARRQSEERSRMIVDTALDGVIMMDAEGRILEWNAQAEAMFGWSREEILGQRVSDTIIPVRYREAHEAGLRRFLETGQGPVLNRRLEMTACHRDGHEFPVEFSISPARINHTYTFSGFVRDVTHRKRAELQLRENEERYRSVVGALEEGVVLVDAKGQMQACNASAERILGLSADELLRRNLDDPRWELIHEDGTPFSYASWPMIVTLTTGQPCSNVIMGVRTPAQTVKWISVNARPLMREPDPLPYAVVVSFTDITDQKRAEQRLRVQHAMNRVLAEATTLKEAAAVILETICEPLGWNLGNLWIVDRQANVLRCMDSWASPTADVSLFQQASRQRTFLRGVGLPGRVWETGRPAWITDIVHDANFPRVPMACTVGLHGVAAFPILVAGHVEGVLEFFSRDIRQPDEHILALMATISSQVGHLIERRQLEEQLRQSQKMEAIGRLAGGIAHDFNNLLTVISGYSQVALESLKKDDPLRAEIEEIKQAGDRAAALTSQLLAFSRRQVIQPKLVDLNVTLVNLEKMLQRLIGEDVNLVVTLAPSLGRIHIDPGQLEQVIMNLAVNARDAMPKGGKLIIETRSVCFTAISPGRPLTLEPGEYVELVVSDTGSGMDEYTRSHMFEPFFTTKEHGKGTGLGLSTVYGIVKQSGAEIVVDSEPGLGTTITVYFPRAGEEEAVTQPVTPERNLGLGHETLLLVEDEPAIRALAAEVLRQQGYKVLEARHGLEALLTGSQYLGPIHLLVTDVIMPQMSGSEVAERLMHERPHLKVLYMSGYTDDTIVHHGVLQDGTAFLQKPFTPHMLVRKVREVLDGR